MDWTHYRQDYQNGVWMLFRENADGQREVFHRQRGWIESDLLSERRQKGQVDDDDIIGETEAEALIASRPNECKTRTPI